MFNMFMLSLIFLFLLIFMLSINYLLMKKKMFYYNKKLPIECGFEPMFWIRLPFSMQFYLIALIFLIFDIEIALILPMILLMNFKYLFMIINMNLILFVLLTGLIMEWLEGAFNWKM